MLGGQVPLLQSPAIPTLAGHQGPDGSTQLPLLRLRPLGLLSSSSRRPRIHLPRRCQLLRRPAAGSRHVPSLRRHPLPLGTSKSACSTAKRSATSPSTSPKPTEPSKKPSPAPGAHLRDGFIVAKVGICAKHEPLSHRWKRPLDRSGGQLHRPPRSGEPSHFTIGFTFTNAGSSRAPTPHTSNTSPSATGLHLIKIRAIMPAWHRLYFRA